MLETLIVVLVVLWLLGMVSSYTIGGLIHLLLVPAGSLVEGVVSRGDAWCDDCRACQLLLSTRKEAR
jgi:hypothetical protein